MTEQVLRHINNSECSATSDDNYVVLLGNDTSIGSEVPPTSVEVVPAYKASSCCTCCFRSDSSSAILFDVVSLMVEKSLSMRFSFRSETSFERASAART